MRQDNQPCMEGRRIYNKGICFGTEMRNEPQAFKLYTSISRVYYSRGGGKLYSTQDTADIATDHRAGQLLMERELSLF